MGISVDDEYEIVDGEIYQRAPDGAVTPTDQAPASDSAFMGIDAASDLLFTSVGLPKLGGISSTRGWSSISAFQRCRYLWKQKYADRKPLVGPGPAALEIGSITHLLLAVRYSQRIHKDYPISVEDTVEFLRKAPVTPAFVDESWRLYDAYVGHWRDEAWMTPLAVEELAVDPRTGFSCRWDLVFRVDKPFENLLPGVYVCNTKTSSDAGMTTRERWRNDGQILGEIDLYRQLKYEKRWGELRAACINLIVKTKVPQFMRFWVLPNNAVLRDHHKSLKIWSAEMDQAIATNVFPKSRSSCVNQYRMLCEMFDECAGGTSDREME